MRTYGLEPRLVDRAASRALVVCDAGQGKDDWTRAAGRPLLQVHGDDWIEVLHGDLGADPMEFLVESDCRRSASVSISRPGHHGCAGEMHRQ
jgi:hypothetical protein